MNTPKAFVMPAELWQSASEDERAEYEFLYLEHLRLIEKGKVVVFMPRGWGTRFQNSGILHTIAQDICERISTNVLVHYLADNSVFRIGQVIDDEDQQATAGAILCFEVKNKSIQAHHIGPTEESQNYKSHKVAKPRNMWILYRQEKHREVAAQHPEMHTSEISKVISTMWQNEPPLIRQHFKRLAEQEKTRHREEYPGYKCSPRKSSQIKKRKQTAKFLTLPRSTPVSDPLAAAPFAIDYQPAPAAYSDGRILSPIFNLDPTPNRFRCSQYLGEMGFQGENAMQPWERMIPSLAANIGQGSMQASFDAFEDTYQKCVSAHQGIKITHQDIQGQFEMSFEAASKLLSFDDEIDAH